MTSTPKDCAVVREAKLTGQLFLLYVLWNSIINVTYFDEVEWILVDCLIIVVNPTLTTYLYVSAALSDITNRNEAIWRLIWPTGYCEHGTTLFKTLTNSSIYKVWTHRSVVENWIRYRSPPLIHHCRLVIIFWKCLIKCDECLPVGQVSDAWNI